MNYSQDICAKAQRIIDERRATAEQQLENRRREVRENAPEVTEIEQNAASAMTDLSKLIISHTSNFEEKFKRIKENNLEAQRYIKEILTAHGYSENYLDIKYFCTNCKDTGFDDSGRRCSCFTELASKLAVEELNGSANMPDCDFQHFDLDYYPRDPDALGVIPYENMKEVLRFCMRYANEFSGSSKSLLMMGDPGLGKTHLSISIAKEVLKKGYSCVYGSIQNFLTDIEKEHFGRAPQGRDTLSVLLEAELLVLDDLGTETTSAFYEATVYNIINTRINTSRPTIVSTNFSAPELQQKYNPRIISRLFGEYSIVNFYGKDIRFIRGKK